MNPSDRSCEDSSREELALSFVSRRGSIHEEDEYGVTDSWRILTKIS